MVLHQAHGQCDVLQSLFKKPAISLSLSVRAQQPRLQSVTHEWVQITHAHHARHHTHTRTPHPHTSQHSTPHGTPPHTPTHTIHTTHINSADFYGRGHSASPQTLYSDVLFVNQVCENQQTKEILLLFKFLIAVTIKFIKRNNEQVMMLLLIVDHTVKWSLFFWNQISTMWCVDYWASWGLGTRRCFAQASPCSTISLDWAQYGRWCCCCICCSVPTTNQISHLVGSCWLAFRSTVFGKVCYCSTHDEIPQILELSRLFFFCLQHCYIACDQRCFVGFRSWKSIAG